MNVFRRYAWVLRNVGFGVLVLGVVLQWRGQSDGPLLILAGVGLAVAGGVRNKIDQDSKVAALQGYEEALSRFVALQGEKAEELRVNGWEDLMIDGQRREWRDQATLHYQTLCDLRFIPLRPSWPDLIGRELEEWRYVGEQMLRQDAPAHER